MLMVLVLNALWAYKHIEQYRAIQQSEAVIKLVTGLFELIRNYGYERGRVNVVLNFRGKREEMAKFKAFVMQHRQEGERGLEALQPKLRVTLTSATLPILDEILDNERETQILRGAYTEQFERVFAERDPTLDDRWFNHLSHQIDLLNRLIYVLKEVYIPDPQLKRYADVLALLAGLRDNAGPAVSYFKAATFHPNSLSSERWVELRFRREKVEEQLGRLLIIADFFLPAVVADEARAFGQFYQGKITTVVTQAGDAGGLDAIKPGDYKFYLKNGVEALERLKALTDEIETYIAASIAEKKRSKLTILIASLALSAIFVIAILLNIQLIYQRVYRRILQAAQVMNELALNLVDRTIGPPRFNDEIGDLEKGLQAFQDNLKQLHCGHEQLKELSTQDSMTRLLNHDAILLKLAEVERQSERCGAPFSVLMIDVDWFKRINDTYGHLVGDQVLTEIAQHLRQAIRNTDVIGRFGGEEFLVILAETDLKTAVDVAEKLRQAISKHQYSELALSLTVSIGVSSSSDEGHGGEILANADDQLYRAKQSGRNQVAFIGR
jgi:diguanylate cyclase (GGDEF)-like protein